MRGRIVSKAIAAATLITGLSGCSRPSQSGGLGQPLAGHEWSLTGLSGQPAGTGSGARAATLQFSPSDSQASGFGGCNRYSSSYTVAGDRLRFGPVAMTMMACPEGMDLEQRLGAALAATRRYRIDGAKLTLIGENGPVAEFRTP